MRKILIGIAVALLAGLVLRQAIGALASDETKIRRRLDGMAEAFAEPRLGPIADGLARDFADRHSGHDRALVLDVLRALFIEHATGPFPYRVLLEDVAVTLDPAGAQERQADVALRARFQDVSGAAPAELWAVDIEARMVLRDGWQVLSSEHVSAAGDWRGLR